MKVELHQHRFPFFLAAHRPLAYNCSLALQGCLQLIEDAATEGYSVALFRTEAPVFGLNEFVAS